MQDKDLSQWFNLEDQKPWEPGVYEVELGVFQNGALTKCATQVCKWLSFWNGKNFCSASEFLGRAAANKHVKEAYGLGVIRWRGLSSNPNPKPRGNPKVTRYVVMDKNRFGEFKGALGVFSSLKNAQEHASNFDFPVRIQKIRFRSPEASK